jgi:predicted outer membrane lipoprotein
MPATFSLPAGNDLKCLLLVLAAFTIYFVAMPLLGNMIASAFFMLAAMWLLSDDPDKSMLRLAIYAILSALAFEVFFVRLLKVQMPAGVFRQWLF